MRQPTLLDDGAPEIDADFRSGERIWLDDSSWIDRAPGWVGGHERLFETLRERVDWNQKRREMYGETVDVPRLTASLPEDGPMLPILRRISEVLSRRYDRDLTRVSASLYRDGSDSVAWHRDRGVRELDRSIVALVSLGGRRTFALRPVGGGESRRFAVGWGDLVVTGGACQRDWEHAVPKTKRADPRIVVMFRHEVD